jgi:hypothetical protein
MPTSGCDGEVFPEPIAQWVSELSGETHLELGCTIQRVGPGEHQAEEGTPADTQGSSCLEQMPSLLLPSPVITHRRETPESSVFEH